MDIIDLDETLADILQRPASELRGVNVLSFTHPDDVCVNVELLEALKQEGTAFAISKRYCLGDGSEIRVNNHVSHFQTKGDEVTLLGTIQVAPPEVPQAEKLLQVTQGIVRSRSTLLETFGQDICGGPGFDILLDLFINRIAKRQVPVKNACLASGLPSTTALRHIAILAEKGLVERRPDLEDRRRISLVLTPEGAARIQRFVELYTRI